MGSWRGYLARLGDRCAEYGQEDMEDQFDTCLAVITRELDQFDDEILDVLMQCVEEIPHKHPLYGTMVGLFNIDEPEFVVKVVRKVHEGLQVALNRDNCNKLRLLLRFLSVLMCSNVVSSNSLVEVFEVLLSSAAVTVDEDSGNPAWQPRADFYIYCIMASLPWCGLELYERAPEELDRIMAAVEAYLNLRTRRSELSPFAFNNEAIAEQDYLQDLWFRVRELQNKGWKCESVSRPHLSFEARLATAQNIHSVPTLTCPDSPKPPAGALNLALEKQRMEAETKFPSRAWRLKLFPSEKSEKNLAPIDRFVIEEYLQDIMFYFNGCRKECASYMAGLQTPFRYEFIMVETIFAQMFLLPKPPFKLIYCSIVIIDLCKALPAAFPSVLAGAVLSLFNKMGDLDVECQYRLIQWMSHHLSNFQFFWPWEQWLPVVEQPAWSPQRVFIQEVLEKTVRLSYWERIKQTLDDHPKLCELLPPTNLPSFKYSKVNQADGSDGLETEVALHADLTAQIKGKKQSKEIQAWFESKVLPSSGHKVAIEVLVQTLLNLGSKSFTHMVTVLERYGQLLTQIAPNQALQVLVVEEVAKFWENSSQMVAIVIDRMMNYRLISNMTITTWAFSEVNVQTFHTSNRVWEVLHNTIRKTMNRTVDLQRDIESAKKTLEEANAAAVKAETSRANVQSLIDSADTDDARRQASARMEWVKTMIEKAKDRQSAAQDLLETKEALVTRAFQEQEALFVTVVQSFASVVTSRIAAESGEASQNAMDIDSGGNDANEADEEQRNGRSQDDDKRAEQAQWLKCTLGQLQSISRQYCQELWRLIDRLNSEVLRQDVHPDVAKAIHTGMRLAC